MKPERASLQPPPTGTSRSPRGRLPSITDITRILSAIEQGEPRAAEQLLPLIYEELRKLAAARMAEERADHTLQPTALVHEAYLRLVEGAASNANRDSRGHFFAAAEAMRRILVDHARRKRRPKHGGDRQRVDIDEAAITNVSFRPVENGLSSVIASARLLIFLRAT
jgi:RNA polymerase sigma factor (TIGR02999 family)